MWPLYDIPAGMILPVVPATYQVCQGGLHG